MSYYPSANEIGRLGFLLEFDDDNQPCFCQTKTSSVSGRTGDIELVNDEGQAMLVEWLGSIKDGDIHGWTACESYGHLEHACSTAFDIIAEGR